VPWPFHGEHHDDDRTQVIKAKVGLLELAKQLGSVSQPVG
jgi:hypothetical protein